MVAVKLDYNKNIPKRQLLRIVIHFKYNEGKSNIKSSS